MKMKCGYFLSLWKNNPMGRLYFMLLFLIPIPALILSIAIFYRLPCINETTKEVESSILLRVETERAKAACSEKEMKIAMANWEDIRKKVPGSYEAVSDWVSDLNRFVFFRGFKMSYSLGELKPAYNGSVDLSLLQLNLKLAVPKIDASQTKFASTGTIQFVELLREIVKNYYCADLAGVVVTGSEGGIKEIDVSINLWVGFGSEPHIDEEV